MSDCDDHHPRQDEGLDGLRCAFCGSPVRRENGEWVATDAVNGAVRTIRRDR